MAIPELKAKKVARAATQANKSADAAKKQAADAAAFTKAITARAAAYEAEYAKVCCIDFNYTSQWIRCMQ